MSQRFLARRNPEKPSCNAELLRQSILELRTVYSNLSDTEYCCWYENHFGVKYKDVKKILGSSENAN